MTVDKIGQLNPTQKYNKTKAGSAPSKKVEGDSISVSGEAQRTADLNKAAEMVRSASDIRFDRVEAVKKKLEDPNYINSTVIESVADSIMKDLGILSE